MSERNNGLGLIAAVIALFILIGMAYYVNYDQGNSIRDLQRRVGELEQER